jgi:CubicO group peptidase (beta-lactamase class C family)
MTKVLAATVLLMLAEKGVVDVEHEVSKYIPSFANDFDVISEPTESDTNV